MKRVFETMIVAMFCAVIFLAPVLTKLETNHDYSIYENRNLAAVPVFKTSDLLDGTYFSAWEAYLSDRIWRRNTALNLFTNLYINILKKDVVNNVVVRPDVLLPFIGYAEGNYAYEEPVNRVAEKLSQLNARVERYGGKFIYIGVPEQYSMLRQRYPWYLNNDDERLSLLERTFFARLDRQGIDHINMRTTFLSQNDYESYYAKTDHHYNLLGAFLTYKTLIRKINDTGEIDLPVFKDDDIEFVTLENPFYGSRSRKLYNVVDLHEKLFYYTVKDPVPFVRYDNGHSSEPFVFDLPDDKSAPVTYNIYMKGDVGETIIETERPHLPNALLFGDSFTNPLETFLYASFDTTVSLDLRHYHEKPILAYIDEYKPDFVFCLRDDTAYLLETGNGNIE